MSHHLNTNKKIMLSTILLAFVVIIIVVIFVILSLSAQKKSYTGKTLDDSNTIVMNKEFIGESR